jgi:hypothetical protein
MRTALGEIGVNHPDMDQLVDFGHGKLSEAKATDLGGHLADCETCQTFLDNLADDALLSLIRPLFTTGPQ